MGHTSFILNWEFCAHLWRLGAVWLAGQRLPALLGGSLLQEAALSLWPAHVRGGHCPGVIAVLSASDGPCHVRRYLRTAILTPTDCSAFIATAAGGLAVPCAECREVRRRPARCLACPAVLAACAARHYAGSLGDACPCRMGAPEGNRVDMVHVSCEARQARLRQELRCSQTLKHGRTSSQGVGDEQDGR